MASTSTSSSQARQPASHAQIEPKATSPSDLTSPMRQQASRGAPNEAATKLIESIDDFLNDIQKKFTTVSEEILGKLDDMAERCDRLEQEMLLGASAGTTGTTEGGNIEQSGRE